MRRRIRRGLGCILATLHHHLTLYREAKLMADIEDIKARAEALVPRVKAALDAANAAGNAAGAASATAQFQADLDDVDNSLSQIEALAPALPDAPVAEEPTAAGDASSTGAASLTS